MARKIDRSKRTKAELIAELEAVEAKVTAAPNVDPTAQSLAKEKATQVRAAASNLSVDAIVSKGATFGLEVQRTVAALTEQATQKAEELQVLQDAIAVETAELGRLYDIDVAAASTKALVEDYAQRREALEREAVAARQAWNEEAAAHAKSVQQRNVEVETARRREQQEYDYRTQQARQQAADKALYEAQFADRERKEAAARFEKEMADRRSEIERTEKALEAGRIRIEGLDNEIKKAADTAVAIATNSLKKELTTQFALERKDLETRNQLAEQRNIALSDQMKTMAAEIAKLHTQLEAARAEVKDIAIKSVEGASGQAALQKVMEVQRETNGTTRNKA